MTTPSPNLDLGVENVKILKKNQGTSGGTLGIIYIHFQVPKKSKNVKIAYLDAARRSTP